MMAMYPVLLVLVSFGALGSSSPAMSSICHKEALRSHACSQYLPSLNASHPSPAEIKENKISFIRHVDCLGDIYCNDLQDVVNFMKEAYKVLDKLYLALECIGEGANFNETVGNCSSTSVGKSSKAKVSKCIRDQLRMLPQCTDYDLKLVHESLNEIEKNCEVFHSDEFKIKRGKFYH